MAINFSSRRRIESLNKLAEGGEASIYEYDSKHVIKLYNTKVDLAQKERKVKYFISIKAKLPPNVIGCPEDIVTVNGRFVGYVMKKLIGAEDLHMLTKPKYLASAHLSNKDVVQIMTNFGKNMGQLHSQGILIGDVSDFNFQISGKSNYFIDVDSWGVEGKFQPDAYTEMFTCPDSYAPNGRIRFSEENENYNFAVLSFNMITGLHPFGGIYLPDKKITAMERMKQKISVLGAHQKDIKVPKIIKSWNWMSPKLEDDFLQIFEKGKRFDITPDLQELLQNMKYCSTHDLYYYSKYNECPICNANAKIKAAPIVAKVTQTGKGPKITMVFCAKDCAYILSNVHYLNKSGEAVHMKTGRKYAVEKGKRIDFSADGKNVYVVSDNTIEIYNENDERVAVIERAYKSAYVVKNSDIYYIDKGNNLVKLAVTENGNMPSYLGQIYNGLFTVGENGKVFSVSMYTGMAVIKTPDYTFEIKCSGKIKEYVMRYDKATGKWLFVYQMANGKYRTMVFYKNRVEYDDDMIAYDAQTLSNIDFYNNTIYDPGDGVITGTNIAKNTAKEFACSVVDEESKLRFNGRGFTIYGRSDIYSYG